jgi:hypothetical protein
MSIGSNATAGDVFTLLRFLMPSLCHEHESLPIEADAIKAAQRIAAAAYRKLYAGVSPDAIPEAWLADRCAVQDDLESLTAVANEMLIALERAEGVLLGWGDCDPEAPEKAALIAVQEAKAAYLERPA